MLVNLMDLSMTELLDTFSYTTILDLSIYSRTHTVTSSSLTNTSSTEVKISMQHKARYHGSTTILHDILKLYMLAVRTIKAYLHHVAAAREIYRSSVSRIHGSYCEGSKTTMPYVDQHSTHRGIVLW